jgi:hypothetical protein
MARLVPVLATGLIVAVVSIRSGTAATDVWARLYRPLHLPRLAQGAPCPVSGVNRAVDWKPVNIFGGSGIGPGPVFPGLGSTSGHVNVSPDTQYGGPWLGGKLFWYVLPSYRGPVLLRGRQLDGRHVMGFTGRRTPLRELRIHATDSVGWSGRPPGSRGIPSGVRVLVPGCYGVQMDGTRFSRVVVFEVID